jgi:hypothetical protein
MKIKIFYWGVLFAAVIMSLAGCDLNPFAKPPVVNPATQASAPTDAVKAVVKIETQNVDALNDIEPDLVKLPDENGSEEALIPGATAGAPATEPSAAEKPVTFDPKDGTTAKLAKCLTQKGVRMYGAYWCPHCQDQKAMFGDAFKFLKYFECDPQGPESQTARCTEDKIESYPTWYFPASGYDPGIKELEKIASLSGCEGAMK